MLFPIIGENSELFIICEFLTFLFEEKWEERCSCTFLLSAVLCMLVTEGKVREVHRGSQYDPNGLVGTTSHCTSSLQ